MIGGYPYRTAATALLFAANCLGTASARTTYTVTMEGIRFEPPSLTITPGDTVVWINKDPFPHTVTAESGGFDSRKISPGKSWRYTPRRAGDFPYVCKLHPTMKGILHVEKTERPGKLR